MKVLLSMPTIFITGGTGYIGSRLIKALLQKGGYSVKALVRANSKSKLPVECEAITGNALDAETYFMHIHPATIFIHLVGVSHPSPAKKHQFRNVDYVSVQQAAMALKRAKIEHFIYLSVAQYPTKIMKDYQEVRASGEALLLGTDTRCSFIRPWYVLGPGHWWPILLKPLYWLGSLIPSTKDKVEKLSTVTIRQIIATLLHCIENPPASRYEIYEVKDIKLQN